MTTHQDDDPLNAVLRGWQAPPASPWLAGKIAAKVNASRAPAWSLFPGPLKVRIAALTMAVIVGWSVGAFVSAPEAAAEDGTELAEILW